MTASRALLAVAALAGIALPAGTGCTLIGEGILSDKPEEAASSAGSPGAASAGGAGGTGGTGGGGGASCDPACADGLACCASGCVDTAKDEAHCGGCDAACDPGKVCVDGSCLDACPAPLSACGADCVNLETDAKNCGVCGNDCQNGRTCERLECKPPWVSVNPINAPIPREQAAVAWAGDRMFVWGGRGPTEDLSDGGLYRPSSDTWEEVKVASAPSPRVLAAAVFTGDRVIVWGGGPFGSQAALGTGGIYALASEKWMKTTNTGAPTGRRRPIAAWTGTHMLVWGGEANSTPIAGGSLYDVAADAWAAISRVGAPGALSGAAWAWTGAELLIFGGRPDGSGASAAGYGYDPARQLWRSLSELGAPSARYDAFGAWQDGSFFVFGGRDATGAALSDGASYDPTTDAWTALPSSPSASARSAPPSRTGWAAWTGLRTVVVAGLDGEGALLLDGAQYEPLSSSWPEAVPPWPSGKQHEYGAFVWTGHEVVVWSGLDRGTLVSDGERYLP